MKASIVVLAVTGAIVFIAVALRPLTSATPAAEAVALSSSNPEMPRRVAAKDGERDGLVARLALREHGRHTTGTHAYSIYSLSIEIENRSYSRMALVEFDPNDLHVELLDPNGNVIAPGPQASDGPIRLAHQVVIPVDSYVGLSAYNQGAGVSGAIQLNAGTAWHPVPGEYQVRGTVALTVSYGRAQLEGANGNLVKVPKEWEGEPQRIELELPLSRITLRPLE
jgi:hypothetical protein